jgi:hypothetical protein
MSETLNTEISGTEGDFQLTNPFSVAQKSDLQKTLTWFSSALLPRFIKDALQAHSRACLQYMWIDSICMVHDDVVD